jgi:predicted phage terminase large subunit-like protein
MVSWMSLSANLALVSIERERRRRRAQATAAAPQSLVGFVEQTSGYTLEDWQQRICNRLQLLLSQKGQRVLLHGPPQFGKSLIVSQRFPAYGLGVDPLHRFRLACYNVTHAERFSSVNLQLMQMPEYRAMFPETRVPLRASVEEWSTTQRRAKLDAQPSFMPLGLGSGFVGVGADTLIIDDPYKNRIEARSETTNAALRGWWTDVVLPRLNPATNVVVMFHRWWEGDFAGYLIEQGGWEQLRFPAIADGGPNDPTGRAPGDLLSPRYDAAYLAGVKAQQGESFEALYQGTPLPASGGMFKRGKVQIVDVLPARIEWARWWDKAATEGGGAYTAGVLLGALPDGSYLVGDVVRGQWSVEERDRIIRETTVLDQQRYGSVPVWGPQDPGQAGVVEAQAFIRLLDGFPVQTLRESGDKATRAEPFASQWNVGNVRLLKGAWNVDYLDEMTSFPAGKYADQVDASSGAHGVLAQQPAHYGADPFAGYRG